MAVWLRQQEIEINKVRVMAQGFADSVAGTSKGVTSAFNAVLEGMFPYMELQKGMGDQELLKKMSHEVSKGPLHFSPVVMNPLRSAVQKIVVPDDFKEKLKKRIQNKRQR